MLDVVSSTFLSFGMSGHTDLNVQVRSSTLRKSLRSAGTSCSCMMVLDSRPPSYVLTMMHTLSKWRHRTMHYADTDEEMVSRVRKSYCGTGSVYKGGDQIPLFGRDTDGSKPKSHYIMGRRNWCCITLQQPSGDLLFDIRVEKEKGHGETVG